MADNLRDILQQKEELERLLAARERYIQDLRNSFSWRITAPLRWLNSRLFQLCINKGRTPLRSASTSEIVNTYLPQLLVLDDGETQFSRVDPVDVIIPVHDAFEMVEACLESVLANSENCHIIVVDDASCDERVAGFLSALTGDAARQIYLTIITNDANLGFVRSVKRAFTHTRNHFVLLNSDTIVPPGWLERLTAPLFTAEHVASVTPFTNSGVICSFPEFCADNELIPGLDVAAQDAFFRDYGPREPVAIPTGVGFCMAFNRRAVNQVGFFDEQSFPRGYGEENDFCMRALKAGWYNVMACNLFVYHRHGASFESAEKRLLLEQGEQILAGRHPEYGNLIREFMDRDPLRPIRETLALLMASQSESGKVIALIDHDLGGGAHYYSESLSRRLVEESFRVLHLKMNPDTGLLKIHFRMSGLNRTVIIPSPTAKQLYRLLGLCSVKSIIVNQLAGWAEPLEMFHTIAAGRIPYSVLLHDYFPVCPNWNLLNADGKYCGQCQDPDKSLRCLKGNSLSGAYTLYGDAYTDIMIWRKRSAEYLSGAYSVVCFSEASQRILLETFSTLSNTVVIEHAVKFPGKEPGRLRTLVDGVLRIGVLNCSGKTKGSGIVEHLVDLPALAELPVELTILGETDFTLPKRSEPARVTLHGRYRREELATLVERYGIQVMLIPSIWPETFCYTVSESLLLGCPIICFDLGAQAERVRRYDSGVVVQEVSADAVCRAFESLLKHPELVEEMSRNALHYLPPAEDAHFSLILGAIGLSEPATARPFASPVKNSRGG